MAGFEARWRSLLNQRCATLILDNVPEHEAGASVGVNGLMRSVGTTIAGAVMAAILTSRTISLGGHVIPDESAFRLCFVVGAGAALAGALVCLLIPRQQVQQAPEAESTLSRV